MSIVSVSSDEINDDVKTQKQKVVKKLKNMQDFLSFTPNPEVKEYQSNVQYLNPKEVDENAIKQKAENELSAQKQVELNKINDNANAQIKAVQDEEEKLAKKYDEKLQENQASFQNSIENKKQNLASQGLGRSSIKEQSVNNLTQKAQSENSELLKEAQNALSALQNKRQELERQRDASLSNFDIAYAVKLQNKIDELTNEVEAYNQKVLKYNNSLKQEEAKNELNYKKQALQEVADNEKRNQELLRFLNKYGVGNYASFAQNQKVQIVQDFLNSISKQEALNALLEDDDFKTLIGETAYNRILQQVQEREE